MSGGWKMRVFTPEQESRLGVNKYGEHKAGEVQGILGESKESKKDSKDTEVSSKKADDSASTDDDSASVDAAVDAADDDSTDSVLPSDDPWPWR